MLLTAVDTDDNEVTNDSVISQFQISFRERRCVLK